jgi:hypothetical protein
LEDTIPRAQTVLTYFLTVCGPLLVVAFVPALAKIFDLRPASVLDMLAVVATAAVWVFLVRFAWERRLLERFLGAEPAR